LDSEGRAATYPLFGPWLPTATRAPRQAVDAALDWLWLLPQAAGAGVRGGELEALHEIYKKVSFSIIKLLSAQGR
jgi:hypothetical protein